MGDAAKGIRAFRDGLKGDEDKGAVEPPAAGALPRTEPEKDELKR